MDQPAGGVGDLMAPPSGFLADRYPDSDPDSDLKPEAPDEAEDDWSMDMLFPDTPAKMESPAPAVPPSGSNSGLAAAFSLASGLAAPPAPGGLRPAPLPFPPPPIRPGALNRLAIPLSVPAAPASKAGPDPVPFPAPVSVSDSQEAPVELAMEIEMEPPSAPETHPLFQGQPLAPAPPPLSRQEDSEPSSGGLVLTLGGAGLILLGVLLACTLPLQWLDLSSHPDEWSRRVTHAGMLVRTAGAAGLMILGLGSLFQRRWAPPLIHAAGWVWAFMSSGILAAAAWHSMSSDAAAGSSAFTGMADMLPALAGLAVPLGMILLYQRPDLPGLCAGADGKPRWTDGLAIPGVMVFICGILITIPAIVMLLCYPSAMPVPTLQILSGAPAVAAWSFMAALGLGVSCAALRLNRWAWWLLLAAAVVLAAAPALAGFSSRLWADFLTALGKPAAESGVPSLTALLAGLSPLPLALVLVMARRAFPSSSPSPS
ncbi:MAG: hypothetical protein EOP86_18120 [Verrucomicrobiaceae bacterium]|nr:MAG: hypothetical protein EOP86_18120 [Verrucomicrobiaceae bacterium]